MKARVPVDVDLEDRLLYGLTPLRLGYVAIVGLAALVAYRMAGPLALRLPICILLLALAAAAGWAQYDGRHADRWVIDAATYVTGNFRIALRPQTIAISWPARRRVTREPELEPASELDPPPEPRLAVPAEEMLWLRGS